MIRRVKIITWIFVLIAVLLGSFLIWNKWTGWLKFSADSINTCPQGTDIIGTITDRVTGNPVLTAAAWVDGVEAPLGPESFKWILPAGNHQIKVASQGYQDASFVMDLPCSNGNLEISLVPSDSLYGSISGYVKIANGVSLMFPATIFLDGKVVGETDSAGRYQITGVKEGSHVVKVNLGIFPGKTRNTPVLTTGQNLINFDFTVGAP